jgi:hypothetical protein
MIWHIYNENAYKTIHYSQLRLTKWIPHLKILTKSYSNICLWLSRLKSPSIPLSNKRGTLIPLFSKEGLGEISLIIFYLRPGINICLKISAQKKI